MPKRDWQKFCSNRCRVEHHKAKQERIVKAEIIGMLTSIVCGECGFNWISSWHNQRHEFCPHCSIKNEVQ